MIETVRTKEGSVSVRLVRASETVELTMRCSGLPNMPMLHKLTIEQAQVLYHAIGQAIEINGRL